MDKCPLCREKTLLDVVDSAYVADVIAMKRSIRCEGCNKNVSTRTAKDHLECCPLYLRRRLLETRLEKLRMDAAYNSMAGVNQQLRIHNYHMQEQIRVVFAGAGIHVPPRVN